MKRDFLFFYFCIILRENTKIMKDIQKLLKQRKNILFSLIDALLIYYYITLGLQSEYALTYIEKYLKVYQIQNNNSSLYSTLLT